LKTFELGLITEATVGNCMSAANNRAELAGAISGSWSPSLTPWSANFNYQLERIKKWLKLF